MNKTILLISIPMLLISPFLTLSSNSYMMMWISMELNIMAFIPIMIFINKKNKIIVNKYFIIQTISSLIFLLSICLNFSLIKEMNFFLNNNLMNFSIIIKLGLPPFQNWYLDLMKNMNWLNCILLSNWQKIIPLLIFSHTYNNNLIYLLIMMCSMLTIFSLNFSSMQLILSFSSITQMSWILLMMTINESAWKWYFIFYIIINSSIMFLLNNININYINQFNNMNNMFIKNMFIIMMFSISGLPPLMGFLIKLMALNYLNSMLITLLMMMLTMITFIMYTRMSLNIMLNSFMKNKFLLLNKIFKNKMMFLNMFLFYLPLIWWGSNYLLNY